jgi:hypothetical protein
VQRGDQWASTNRYTNRTTGTTTRTTRTDSGAAAVTRRGPGADSGVVRTGSGDVYAGRDGNVYRRNEGGGWDKYEGGGWQAGNRPTPTSDQLNRDYGARREGTQRTNDYGSYRSSGGGGASSYRGSGGGYRGGGSRGGGGRRR